jgi:anti-sigma factor RsiW
MSTTTGFDTAEHRWAAEQLPWLVNGRLPDADALRLRAHLSDCAHCRRDLEIEQRLAQKLGAAPVVDYAPQASLAKLMRRLDSPPARQPWWHRRRNKKPAGRSPLALVFALQAAALAALSVTVAWLAFHPAPPPVYHTLSQAPAASAGQIQVVFAETATTADMRASLSRIGGHIVDGPSRAGVFRVALEAPTGAEPVVVNLQAAVALLTEDPAVRYAAAVTP